MRCLLCFFLQNGYSGRGCLNNICIASYGVGAKFFTTNLMSVDLLQNTPKTRKPIAERTSHKWHGYTHQGVQQSLLHQTTATPLTECTERTEPSCRERTPTDGTDEHRLLWCAVLPQNSQNRQNWAAWVWQECHTLLICEHPCSSAGGSSLPEGSVLSVGSVGIQSPTDFTLSLQKNTTQSHKLQNDQGKTMIAKDSFVPLL